MADPGIDPYPRVRLSVALKRAGLSPSLAFRTYVLSRALDFCLGWFGGTLIVGALGLTAPERLIDSWFWTKLGGAFFLSAFPAIILIAILPARFQGWFMSLPFLLVGFSFAFIVVVQTLGNPTSFPELWKDGARSIAVMAMGTTGVLMAVRRFWAEPKDFAALSPHFRGLVRAQDLGAPMGDRRGKKQDPRSGPTWH